MDVSKLLKVRQAWHTFRENHPRFPEFMHAVKNKGLQEGTMIYIAVRYPDGETLKSGLRVKPSDLEILELMLELMRSKE
ncbi:MAG: hypothetical protein J5927_01410 [Oscillospiraceae bacterium]|nr:hypothetical protein [Oscillospiraceae bacterium]